MRSLVSANAPPYKQHPYHLPLSETLFRSLIFLFRSLVLFQKQNMLKLAKFLLKLVSSCFTAKTILNLIALDVKSLIFF